MTTQDEPQKAPLDEVMMAMDVVDTLRHRQDLVLRELDGAAKESRLIDRLRDVYHNQGIDVPDHILKQGVEALEQDRFVYEPSSPSFGRSLSELYVSRGQWGKPVLAIFSVVVLAFGAYFFAYKPYQSAQREQTRVELAEVLPAQMQQLRDAIFEETKVQSAVTQADSILAQGQSAAREGNQPAALDAVTKLTDLRDGLRLNYELRVVNRDDVRSGFWTFPEVNEAATNYYLVVEAIGQNGDVYNLPILNEENGSIDRVDLWGVRVPENVYDRVVADKQDNGIIDNNIIGQKQAGFTDVKYSVPILGGTVTQW